jgi:transcriptional regulator GlxA family with amidase domain
LRKTFRCGNGIPVSPDVELGKATAAEIIIIPELWLAPSDDMSRRYAQAKEWIRQSYRNGSTIYTACSGSVLLAATGLLNGPRGNLALGVSGSQRRLFRASHAHLE